MKENLSYINNSKPLVSALVKDVVAYNPITSRDKILSKQTYCDLPPLKLDWNESTLPPSTTVKNALVEALACEENLLNWYPELFSKNLRQKIGEYCNRQMEEVLVTNGSDDALDLICKVFLDPGDEVVIPYPTYTHFVTYVQSRGAVLKKVEAPDPFKPDISSIIENLSPATKLIYVVNPNNPTGVLISKKQISTLCSVARNSIVIIDEAYFEFAGETVVDLIDRHSNLIITRTFSKAWALAGLRVGYLVTNIMLIDELSKVINPKSVSVLAQIAAAAALSDKKYMDDYVIEVKNSKMMLLQFFRSRNIVAHDSSANYIMVQHPKLLRFIEELEKENVFVRDRSSFKNLPGFFRITLGDHIQTDDLITRLEKALSRV
ncbi:MAG TPA: histidinol-phosphate transaminase [bacterium]|nr:histidinol-phosphate transaminase [bacterium]